MGRQQLSMRPVADDALKVLGSYIYENRIFKKYTAKMAGQAIGVTPRTWRMIEKGEPTVSAGHYFNAAAMLGIPLFARDARQMAILAGHRKHIDSLLPDRAYAVPVEIDNDF